LAGDPVHPDTRAKLEKAIEKLERTLASDQNQPIQAPDKVNAL
jgi:hypothetical protein